MPIKKHKGVNHLSQSELARTLGLLTRLIACSEEFLKNLENNDVSTLENWQRSRAKLFGLLKLHLQSVPSECKTEGTLVQLVAKLHSIDEQISAKLREASKKLAQELNNLERSKEHSLKFMSQAEKSGRSLDVTL